MNSLKKALQLLQAQQFEKFTIEELNEMPRGTKLVTDVSIQDPIMLVKHRKALYGGVWFDMQTKEQHPPEAVVSYFEDLLNLDFAMTAQGGFQDKIDKLTKQRDEAIQFVLDTLYVGAEYTNAAKTYFAAFVEETSGEKPYRLIWYNQSGLFGHFEVGTFEDAAKEIVSDLGYEIKDATGSMDQFALTEEWAKSLEHMQEIQRKNRESWEETMKTRSRLKKAIDLFGDVIQDLPADIEKNPLSLERSPVSEAKKEKNPNKSLRKKKDDANISSKDIGTGEMLVFSPASPEEFLYRDTKMDDLRNKRKQRLASWNRQSQREPRGPAFGAAPSGTVFDRLFSIAESLEDTATEEIYAAEEKDFDVNLETAKTTADSLGLMLSTLGGIIEDADEGSELKELEGHVEETKVTIESLEETLTNLGNVDVPWSVDFGEDVKSDVLQLLNEIKQVGIDAKGGVTSPIDLADWLY